MGCQDNPAGGDRVIKVGRLVARADKDIRISQRNDIAWYYLNVLRLHSTKENASHT